MAHYGTADSVRKRTGVQPVDLGLEDDTALDALLDEVLEEVTDLMDRRMRKSFLTETIPAGLHGIANDIVASSVRDFTATRRSAIVQVDDFTSRILTPRIFTDDVKERLRLYASSGAATLDISADLRDAPDDVLTAILWDEE